MIALINFPGKKLVFTKQEIARIRQELEEKTNQAFIEFTLAKIKSWHTAKRKVLD